MSKGSTPQNSGGTEPDFNHNHTPLISALTVSDTALPTVTIPDCRYTPLCKQGARRAVDTPGTIEDHMRGILGEFAAAKFFGVPERLDTEIYEYGDPGHDFRVAGKTVDVKTAQPRWEQPSLVVDANKDLVADVYLLVHEVATKCYQIIGYAPSAVVARAPVRSLSRVPWDQIRMVDQDRLFPVTQAGNSVFG